MDDLDQATRALASTEVKTPDARETSDLRPTQALVDLYIADPERRKRAMPYQSFSIEEGWRNTR